MILGTVWAPVNFVHLVSFLLFREWLETLTAQVTGTSGMIHFRAAADSGCGLAAKQGRLNAVLRCTWPSHNMESGSWAGNSQGQVLQEAGHRRCQAKKELCLPHAQCYSHCMLLVKADTEPTAMGFVSRCVVMRSHCSKACGMGTSAGADAGKCVMPQRHGSLILYVTKRKQTSFALSPLLKGIVKELSSISHYYFFLF